MTSGIICNLLINFIAGESVDQLPPLTEHDLRSAAASPLLRGILVNRKVLDKLVDCAQAVEYPRSRATVMQAAREKEKARARAEDKPTAPLDEAALKGALEAEVSSRSFWGLFGGRSPYGRGHSHASAGDNVRK